ncbi:MAG: T9SS type A sorting domain-containing protein [Candidatus Kapabacteria bacterium]|nr:T9SS type A sorting domain-containing protein [Candidatus Kapabacteria bacterium]
MKKFVLLIFLYAINLQGLFAEWNQVCSFDGEFIYDMFKKDKFIFAATSNGIYRSSGYALIWLDKSGGITKPDIRKLILFDNNIYACSYGGGVYVSTDNGEVWIEKNNGLTNKKVFSIASLNNYIFAYTMDGMFVSSDKGENWIFKNNGLPEGNMYDVSLLCMTVKGNTIFIGASWGKGIYSSTDFGNNWIPKSKGLADSNLSIYSFCVHNNLIYAGTYNGIIVSSDNGENWKQKNQGITGHFITSFATIDHYIFTTAYKDGIYQSSDSGDNWTRKSYFLTDTALSSLIFTDTKLFAGSYAGTIFVSKLSDLGIVSSVEDKNTENGWNIYPNPAGDYIEISVSNKVLKPFAETDKVQIFDILGMEVITTPCPLLVKEGKMQIDISHLQSGVYYINIGDRVEKFMKM